MAATTMTCAGTQVPTCELDLSAAGFMTELTHAQATHRTPAFDDYTKGSYHVGMATLLDAARAERARTPGIRALMAVGPFGPLWQYNVALFVSEGNDLRLNVLAMPHARITWKATKLISTAEFDQLAGMVRVATVENSGTGETTVLFVTWTSGAETIHTNNANLYKNYPQELERALAQLEGLSDGAVTTYSNDLGDEIPIHRCSPSPGLPSAQRTRHSAAWPATRNGNALATRQRSGPRPLQWLS